ncbi:MAG: hypothetical protein KC457_33890, partial [Myxococcales bacterium]|nr:hypothetical protein [Myxococcales bacterium]
MLKTKSTVFLALGALLAGAGAEAWEFDLSGSVGLETRAFTQKPRFPAQADASVSFSFQPELYATWGDDRQSLLFVPFVRLDQNDS